MLALTSLKGLSYTSSIDLSLHVHPYVYSCALDVFCDITMTMISKFGRQYRHMVDAADHNQSTLISSSVLPLHKAPPIVAAGMNDYVTSTGALLKVASHQTLGNEAIGMLPTSLPLRLTKPPVLDHDHITVVCLRQLGVMDDRALPSYYQSHIIQPGRNLLKSEQNLIQRMEQQAAQQALAAQMATMPQTMTTSTGAAMSSPYGTMMMNNDGSTTMMTYTSPAYKHGKTTSAATTSYYNQAAVSSPTGMHTMSPYPYSYPTTGVTGQQRPTSVAIPTTSTTHTTAGYPSSPYYSYHTMTPASSPTNTYSNYYTTNTTARSPSSSGGTGVTMGSYPMTPTTPSSYHYQTNPVYAQYTPSGATISPLQMGMVATGYPTAISIDDTAGNNAASVSGGGQATPTTTSMSMSMSYPNASMNMNTMQSTPTDMNTINNSGGTALPTTATNFTGSGAGSDDSNNNNNTVGSVAGGGVQSNNLSSAYGMYPSATTAYSYQSYPTSMAPTTTTGTPSNTGGGGSNIATPTTTNYAQRVSLLATGPPPRPTQYNQ
jgi:hypothetical protein